MKGWRRSSGGLALQLGVGIALAGLAQKIKSFQGLDQHLQGQLGGSVAEGGEAEEGVDQGSGCRSQSRG